VLFRVLTLCFDKDECTMVGFNDSSPEREQNHHRHCPHCQAYEALQLALREVPLVEPNQQIIQCALEDLATRLERLKRAAERFRGMGRPQDAAGCGRAIAELVTFRSALQEGFK
jgi:hypothetical protein